MSFQKCPLCNGEGSISSSYTTVTRLDICPTCKGTRIISTLTELPPSGETITHAIDKINGMSESEFIDHLKTTNNGQTT